MDTKRLMINYPCKFHYGDEPDAWQAWFNDDEWERVLLPHDWSVHMPFCKDYSSGTGYLAGGIGWYRIDIAPRSEWAGKKISITFDGVYKNSRVWCNSYYLGERPNGYVSFTYDLTDFFKFDDTNVVCVYVDRREIADSRWFTGSGIIGKVYITIEEQVHPKKDEIFFFTSEANESEAVWNVKSIWKNETGKSVTLPVKFTLLDEKGNVCDEATDTIEFFPDDDVEHFISSTIKNPRLWSTKEPYLYRLLVTAELDGKVCVMFDEKVGIREFKFDPDKGFFLNGKPEVFKGVCLHHDAGVLGGAVPPAVWHDRLMRLKKMGCNSIRMSHNPHVPELYDLCDSLGFMVMDEAFDEWEGPKNKWSTGHNVYPPKHQGYYVNFHTWAERDLTDMILRNRNHPSIIMWSTGNEIDYPNDPYCNEAFKTSTGNNDANKPAAERMFNPKRPNATRLKTIAKKLTDIAKSADNTRPVTLAAAFPELSVQLGFIDSLDVVGFNYRENLYEENHKAYPDKPFLGSENGHGLKQWKAVTDNEYISGQFLWTGIDYLGETIGWPTHGSSAGLMTVAGLEKPGFYRRQSFWSEAPCVSIATVAANEATKTRWGQSFDSPIECEFSNAENSWKFKEGEAVVVKCYTNASAVELFLNGTSLGKKEKSSDYDCVLFEASYKPGELKALALDKNGNEVACDVLYSYGEVTQCRIDCLKVSSSELPLLEKADSSTLDAFNDLYRYEITLLDRDGKEVRNASNSVIVSCEGGAVIGLENGDLSDVTDYSLTSERRAYKGKLVVYTIGEGKLSAQIKD